MLTAIKGEMDSNTIIIGDFNTPHSPMDRSSKVKINKETQALNDTFKGSGYIFFLSFSFPYIFCYLRFKFILKLRMYFFVCVN